MTARAWVFLVGVVALTLLVLRALSVLWESADDGPPHVCLSRLFGKWQRRLAI